MNEVAVKIENVSKEYRLGAIGGTTLRDDLQRLWAKLLKKEDPTTKIGTKNVKLNEKFLALDDISLQVNKGEAVGIIGHNGAGKSTLLKLLSRVTAPTKGTISFNGRIASMLEVGTGFHPELTGRENVYMNGAILGMTKEEIAKKFDEIVAFAEMEKFIDTPVKRYSSGMYVKLAFAVAAHLDSEILIMDEVLAVGDMKFQQKCLGKMKDAASRESRTVLYVSHNMNTIRQLCSRCIVLDHGKIIFDGDVEKAIQLYIEHNMDYNTSKNYEDIETPPWITKNDIKLISAEYVDKQNCSFENGEPLKIRLKWKNNCDINNLNARFVVYSSDDTRICASFAYNFYSGKAGDVSQADFLINISALAPGDYQCYYVMFIANEFGTNVDVEYVKGLDFSVKENVKPGELAWRSNIWGKVRLPKAEVIQIENIDS
ncbi:MAG: ATP-binding cassette domain-containing protein [Clostridia bacterium]|nr:ATP-binding cassette domain-containing protein [Clostridia bacterium]MBQ8766760.1 ATP-binding cassette domain-containing protein [Clostridia bacterium]